MVLNIYGWISLIWYVWRMIKVWKICICCHEWCIDCDCDRVRDRYIMWCRMTKRSRVVVHNPSDFSINNDSIYGVINMLNFAHMVTADCYVTVVVELKIKRYKLHATSPSHSLVRPSASVSASASASASVFDITPPVITPSAPLYSFCCWCCCFCFCFCCCCCCFVFISMSIDILMGNIIHMIRVVLDKLWVTNGIHVHSIIIIHISRSVIITVALVRMYIHISLRC